PVIVATSLAVLDLVAESDEPRRRLVRNGRRFRDGLAGLGFTLIPGSHPIIPIMLADASVMAERLLERGIYVVGFSFPVVPRGQPGTRPQRSAATGDAETDEATAAFAEVGRALGVVA